MGTHLLQPVLACGRSQLAASFFQYIAEVLGWGDFDDCSSGRGIYHHDMGGHTSSAPLR